ncbi:3-methyl-2-oxobutanoate hydroxymethyltransferase [Piscinibacter sp.]|uniref:3-methyl-2-oxobutanoate hydroxymethyltransferase n=1 Tax=Piscinibacter sp. TaxID=1903157 RepID=UPI002CDD0DB6|nr:3-methyl-2-oxobutanoate hydroxymethyltransferase [Albitalea sp.]HUG23071.1 3-methyl-2-oxobutanoate hydroxymethyltransferase [Albitalea sp.]
MAIRQSRHRSNPAHSPTREALAPKARKRVTLRTLLDLHARGVPIAMLTAYDAAFARLADGAGADCILVADSLGMLAQGHGTTLLVTLEQMVYHTGCVARGTGSACIVADLPLTGFPLDLAQALRGGAALLQAGAQMVKLAGGAATKETVHALATRGIPVCAHLGLTAGSVYELGDRRMPAMDDASTQAQAMRAVELAQAGAAMVLLESTPPMLATTLRRERPELVTIGVDSGAGTSGQMVATHDVLGMGRRDVAAFDFMDRAGTVDGALRAFVDAVKAHQFPQPCEPTALPLPLPLGEGWGEGRGLHRLATSPAAPSP